jgi:hypothetical protein
MKKVLALVLAVMMLATVAFAAGTPNPNQGGTSSSNSVLIKGGAFMPGDKIYVWKGMTQTTGGSVDGDFDKAVNSDNYSLTKVKYEEGKSLVEDIYFDDDNDQLVIKLADNTNLTTTKDLEVSFTLKGKGRDINDVEVTVTTKVGYRLINDAYIIDADHNVTWDNPTGPNGGYTPEFSDLAFFEVVSAANGAAYGDLEFTTADDDVDVVVRVYDGDKLYLYNDVKADKDILKAYADSDAEISFLNFPGDTTFNATATVYMYKDENSYIYEVKNGKLVESNAKWSDDDGCWILKARTLGSYVFSDVDLDVTEDVDDTTTNPDTGANDVVGIAAALGAVALVSAAAVSLKK